MMLLRLLRSSMAYPVLEEASKTCFHRFVEAASQYKFDFVVRICADNPFLSLQKFEELIAHAEAARFDFDYLSFAYGPKPTILTHFGFFVELVRTEALRKALAQTNEKLYLEHVTNYIYKHPEAFKIKLVDLPLDFVVDSFVRLTVDTLEDFDLACSLYQTLMDDYNSVEIEAINTYLAKHPVLLTKMKHQIELNEK